jgi:hypothetical protein
MSDRGRSRRSETQRAVRAPGDDRAWSRGASRGELYSSDAPDKSYLGRHTKPLWSAANMCLSNTAGRVYRCLRGALALAAGRDGALDALDESRVHREQALARPSAVLAVIGLGRTVRDLARAVRRLARFAVHLSRNKWSVRV